MDEALALARAAILGGRAAEAVAALAGAADTAEVAYWRAAALGAGGDREAATAELRRAETLHGLRVMQAAGADLIRFRDDGAYALQVAQQFYAADRPAVASLGFGRALAEGTDPNLLVRLGLSLQHQGRMGEAADSFDLAEQLRPGGGALPFLLYSLVFAADGVRAHAAAALRWRAGQEESGARPPLRARLADRPLRVGYVLPSLGGQARQFLLPVLERHDRRRVRATLYLANPEPAPKGVAVRAIGALDDAAAAALIREDGVDLLVDLWGHTAGGRLGLFVRRPAPVQASWLNYVQTTGVPEIDVLLHADCMAAPGDQEMCAETIWRIGPVIAPFRPDALPPLSPAPCLASGQVTFGSYNHPSRLNDEVVDAWAEILRRTPGSRLRLRYRYYADEVLVAATQMRFAMRGVDPERISCAGALAQPDYYRSYAEIDLALDPSPCPGGTTTLDAVANGVPVLTLEGPDYYSRIGVAVLGPMGMDALIARSWSDYIDRAVALAGDPARLDALRGETRKAFANSGRRDEIGFTRRFETLLRRIVEHYAAPTQVTQATQAAA